MSQGVRDKRIAFSIARHLQSQASSGVLDEDGKEEVEVAIQCICQAYSISIESDSDKELYEVKSTLEELFSSVPMNVSDEDKKRAEIIKQQGNIDLKFEKYEDAIECYTKAMELDSNNSTYYCNRAAALIKLEKLDMALQDCKKALSLNPSYARAHGRLGYIYSSQSKFELSKECFQKALELDPTNESYRANLTTVEEQLRVPNPAAAPGPPPSGGGGAGGVGGAEGGADPSAGLGGLLGMVQNPGFMNMAANLIQTPAFQNMASQMISRGVIPTNISDVPPDMMSGVTQAARDMQQSNPEMFQNIQQQVFQGLSQQPGSDNQQGGGGAGDGGEANPNTDQT